jgi:hypothetical protein
MTVKHLCFSDFLTATPVLSHFLDLTTKASFGERRSMPDVMLDRFCTYILPKTYYNHQSSLVKPSSIERILLSCDYFTLYKLILNSIKPEVFYKIFIRYEIYWYWNPNNLVFVNHSFIFVSRRFTYVHIFEQGVGEGEDLLFILTFSLLLILIYLRFHEEIDL